MGQANAVTSYKSSASILYIDQVIRETMYEVSASYSASEIQDVVPDICCNLTVGELNEATASDDKKNAIIKLSVILSLCNDVRDV